MKMEQTECSESSEYKIQTPGNYPKESTQHLVHGESLKSRILPGFFQFPALGTVYVLTFFCMSSCVVRDFENCINSYTRILCP